ncbi:MAG TPA: sulfotransferase domain-containing protein [Dongiaceae bacterium]|jgi:hypothetical protein|nr:sulfotransferase domain-containing protein [Dongiaceae bacterium]
MAFRFRPRHQRAIEDKAKEFLAFCHRKAFPARQRRFPPILINTLPKSGSKYILRSLSRTLQVDDIRIQGAGLTRAGIAEPNFKRFIQGNHVCQEHLPAEPHIVAALETAVPRVVLHLRDPRAALVSWVHHVNTIYKKGHYVAILQGVETRMPEKYFEWGIPDQLAWQTDHFLPTTVNWISRWMDVIEEKSSSLEIMITTYPELAADSVALLARILKFYQIDFEPDWISRRAPEVGKWNYRAGQKADWRDAYTPVLLDRATALIAERERNRFDWR